MPERLLEGRWTPGLVRISEAPSCGMLEVHAAQDDALAERLAGLGLGLPAPGRISGGPAGDTGWTGPREILVFCLPSRLAVLDAALRTALAGTPALVADMSEARAVLRLDGQRVTEVLAKLLPLDLLDAGIQPGAFLRSRLESLEVLLRFDADGADLLCPRSAAMHVFGLLSAAARPGSEIG